MNIALEPILLIVPFLLTGLWIVLYRSRTVRVDIYHHTEQNTLPEPPRQPTVIAVRPTRYTVVNEQRKQIEVKS